MKLSKRINERLIQTILYIGLIVVAIIVFFAGDKSNEEEGEDEIYGQ